MKAFASQERMSRRFRKESFLQTRFGLEVSPAIQNAVENSISKSMKWPDLNARHGDFDMTGDLFPDVNAMRQRARDRHVAI
jgi:hypothetical protein